jgi:uncharacterized protein YbaR (Trm112 family)
VRLELCPLLRCPECKRGNLKGLNLAGSEVPRGGLRCETCEASFPVEGGVPIFLPRNVQLTSSDQGFSDLDRVTQQKILQREWHDRAHIEEDDGYKRSAYTDQGLFAFLLYYQLREVEKLLAGRRYPRIANIGCGHGFELDYLSRLGSNVTLVDISPKSLERASARARKLGLQVDAVCSDAENLPFRDNSFDLVLTHHSLHHLANPMAGLEEMLRVAKSRVAFFEPARGVMRSLVRVFGLKPEVEDSGNAVYEFGHSEVRDMCRGTGTELQYFRKCLITGPTSQPKIFKKLDTYGVSAAVCSSIGLGNRLLGRLIGTKCSVLIEKNGGEIRGHSLRHGIL